jgi:hypothetical protein
MVKNSGGDWNTYLGQQDPSIVQYLIQFYDL